MILVDTFPLEVNGVLSYLPLCFVICYCVFPFIIVICTLRPGHRTLSEDGQVKSCLPPFSEVTLITENYGSLLEWYQSHSLLLLSVTFAIIQPMTIWSHINQPINQSNYSPIFFLPNCILDKTITTLAKTENTGGIVLANVSQSLN